MYRSLLAVACLAICFVAQAQNDKLAVQAEALAKKNIIVDGHVDLPFRMVVKGFMVKKEIEDVSVETTGNFDHPKAKRGGLDAPFMSIYIPSRYQQTGGAKAFADSLIDMVSQLPDEFPELFALANSPQDIEANFKKGLISLPMGMENGAPIEDDLANVEYFFNRGIRYVTLTHATDNQICDSSYDESDDKWDGLSPFGEEVVKEMNRLGMLVDISHVSDKAFYDVMKIVKAPVIASHSSARKFTPGFERNMDDDMIKLLGENDGVIHINFGSSFLSKEYQDNISEIREHLVNYRAEKGLSQDDEAYQEYAESYMKANKQFEDVEKVADHIDHVVSLVGIDHVGFGSDYDGVGDSLPTGLKDVSTFPNLIRELLERGYSKKDIAKICYKNTFRVWNKVQKVAADWEG
ncbi:MAG: dipeptidase [Cytophagales bacterium]|nr:dipeptidase [Cytophagales bacterium]